MQGDVPNDPNYTDDDMSEGDLGDGSGARALGHIGTRSRGKLLDFLSHPGSRSSDSLGIFSWTSCRAMYAAFREDLDAAREQAGSMEKRKSESSSEDTNEELHRRLQHVTEEVELLRTELEVTHRHLEGKHQALRILQGQAILDKATCHTKSLLQKSEERTKALEKEVNALQWEITFNQVQFKNVEISWSLKYERLVAENEALKETLDDRMREHREQMAENASLSQKCLELLSMLSAKERRDFQRTQPPRSLRTDDSTLELAVFGACQCSGGEPCCCARSAAASRKQVLQLKLELEQMQKRKEEAYAMMDAYRIAFEQQLRRVGEDVLRLAETDRRPLQTQRHDRGKRGSLGVAERLKNLLPAAFKVPDESGEVLHVLLDLLNDKEEALAHQRKVSYMLARNTEDMEKRLQLQLEELGLSHKDAKASGKSEWSVDRDTRDCQSHLIESGCSATDDQQNTELIQPSTTDHTNYSISDEKCENA